VAIIGVGNKLTEYDAGDVEIISHLGDFSWEIVEHKQADEALRVSEEQYRELFNNAEIGIFRSRLDGSEILDVNRKFLDIVGATWEETIGKPATLFWADPTEREQMVQRLLADGRVSGFEFRMLNKQGLVRNCLTTLVLNREQGVVEGTIIDITERTRAEEEKAKLEAQLQQAQKMESVGRLAGGVAHDFNNMLTVILCNAELAIKNVNSNQSGLAYLAQIRKAAEYSADLTRQLLAFARKQVVEPKVLDINKTVARMLTMLQRLIGEDIHLTWKPAVGLWAVKMDPSQLDQILANLCVNARDAISGVGKITIETGNFTMDDNSSACHADFVPGEYVLIAVSDNGCGMDKETLSFIFEPFFTTKEMGKGTGLGLSTVYGAVKQNKGFIDVNSEPDSGTTFTIYLPRYVGKVKKAPTERALGPDLSGKETILLVEDDPEILNIAMYMLETQGYTVLAAKSPGEAIILAKDYSGEIHLLLTDVVMPEMNGLDLANKLLAIYPRLKRLFMSGYTADVIANQGVLDEGLHFIQKPFSPQTLAAKMREVLNCKD
jgi:PAS domain S-box-containing protein